MAGPILYSTNPWLSHVFAEKHLNGKHFIWCSEYFDPKMAPHGSAESAIAPSSSPKGILETLRDDCKREDSHSALIKGYRKTFRRLAKTWYANSIINKDAHDDIMATVNSHSWSIWRPILYIIPRENIENAGRLITVPHKQRAAFGPELQIHDLTVSEFDFIEGNSI